MIVAGLARTPGSYAGLEPPFDPGSSWPELEEHGIRAGRGPNRVYDGVREALFALGLDAAHFGSAHWNPLGALVRRGGHVVLKPNFIRHFNPLQGRGGSLDSVVTHGSLLRAMADYARIAVGTEGSVTIAEAPQQDCDFGELQRLLGLAAIVDRHARAPGGDLLVLDLRREEVRFRGGVVVERRPLPGDPRGYRSVDLGPRSFFSASGLDPARFRGADYDPGPTTTHHTADTNAYLLSETALSADLIVNLPKIKTHKKTGVTLALKNLVGINGDKNWLPHHTQGSEASGGDEFPGGRLVDRARSAAVEQLRPWLARGRGLAAVRAARRLEEAARGTRFVRSGNWHGNRTTWRMCCDLNRCVYFSDRKGIHLGAPAPVRQVLTLLDGVVAGEGEGPLSPTDVPLGALVAATDPVAADLVALRLMGFDEGKIPKIREAMASDELRFTALRSASDLRVFTAEGGCRVEKSLDEIVATRSFRAHPGWRGHLELNS